MGAGGAFFDADGDGAQDLLFVNSMSWPGRPAKKSLPALYRNNRDGTFTDVTASSGSRRADLRHGRGRGRLRQRWQDRRLHHVARPQPPVPQPRRLSLRGRDRRGRCRQRRASRRARSGSTTTATAVSTSSSRTTSTGRSKRICYCTLDGKTKSYCTPESYKGQSPALFTESRQRKVRGHDEESRRLRSGRQGARDRAARSQRRRLARSVRGQRHAAEPPLREQAERHVHRHRRRGRRGVQRGRRRTGRHGRGCGRLRRLRPPEPGHRQLLERDDGALPERGTRGSSSTRRPPPRSARRRCSL